jgi:hypothetical protein
LRAASKVACGEELLLALEIDRVEFDILFGLLNLSLHIPVTRLQREQIVSRVANLGFCPIKGKLELLGIEPEQNGALGDFLVVMHQDFTDDSADIGRQSHLVGLHIRVLGRHGRSAGHVVICSDHKREREQSEHQGTKS